MDKFYSYLQSKLSIINSNKEFKGKNDTDIEKIILKLVDLASKGCFKGTVSIKIDGYRVLSPLITDETNLNKEYNFINLD